MSSSTFMQLRISCHTVALHMVSLGGFRLGEEEECSEGPGGLRSPRLGPYIQGAALSPPYVSQ